MTTTTDINHPRVVSRGEWIEARKKLLAKEKEATRQRDALAAERRKLPWVRVDEEYKFEGPGGEESLADLFAGCSQLLVYHFMFGPDWEEGCPICSMVGDGLEAVRMHLPHRDVTLAAVSRAPLPKIQAFKQRMGWGFTWVSSFGNSFNRDFHVSFTPEEVDKGEMYYNYGVTAFPAEEAHGTSVFYRDSQGNVFHTYSCYARGSEIVLPVYQFLDLVPKGRDEGNLEWPMAWVRHHDRYGKD